MSLHQSQENTKSERRMGKRYKIYYLTNDDDCSYVEVVALTEVYAVAKFREIFLEKEILDIEEIPR